MFYNVTDKRSKVVELFLFFPDEKLRPRDKYDVVKAVREWTDWVDNKIPTVYGFNGYENAIADQVDTIARLHAGGEELKDEQAVYCKMLDEQDALMKELVDGDAIPEPVQRGSKCKTCKHDSWLEYQEYWQCARCGHVDFK